MMECWTIMDKSGCLWPRLLHCFLPFDRMCEHALYFNCLLAMVNTP